VSTAEAISEIAESTKSYATFALSETCHTGLGPTLELADDTSFRGNSAGHSNGDIRVTAVGSSVTTTEPLTYLVEPFDSLDDDPVNPPRRRMLSAPPHPLPAIRIEDYQPGGRKRNSFFVEPAGTDDITPQWLDDNDFWDPDTGQLEDHIYYSPRDIVLPEIEGGRGTFVAGGKITLLGGDYSMRSSAGEGTVDRVVLFANGGTASSCADVPAVDGIEFRDSFGTWRGVIYAPNGTVNMGVGPNANRQKRIGVNDSSSTRGGMLVANKLDLDGSNYRFNSNSFISPGPRGVRLYR
jgi:hypothetical protein